MPLSQRIVQVCLFLVAFIALAGGALQLYLGQPTTTPRLDNVHRFMAGVYFSTGLINLWAALTIRRQGTLVYLLAFGVLMAGLGRLLSISQVGLPEPALVWLGYLVPELLLPVVIALAHAATQRQQARIDKR
ncbi:DUF4345 domain-containing protein [Roseateles violae]|uniref:DUF4345 domain-containing protein n=1 Tax=Roseateles violae TaxID=3058042 RepID=A0ABT8E000_9BURK|nr:DUF4345 domain-containing protein [Pelomonas sp. PFR6]MDN3923129.1 DUF4345 domain-containing protein [Pelomonas sp. PFR6]